MISKLICNYCRSRLVSLSCLCVCLSVCLSVCNSKTIAPINSFPLIPAETAFRGSPSYRPISPSSIAPLTGRYRPPGRPRKPCAWINPFLAHIKRWRYIRWRSLWHSQIISAHVSRLHSRISGWFVQFLSSLFLHSFTCFNGCVTSMDARLGFGTRLRWFCDRFVTVGFGENERFAVALGSGSNVD